MQVLQHPNRGELRMRIFYKGEQTHAQIEADVEDYLDRKGLSEPDEDGDYVIFRGASLEEGSDAVYDVNLDYDN